MYCSIHHDQLSLITLTILVVWCNGIELRSDKSLYFSNPRYSFAYRGLVVHAHFAPRCNEDPAIDPPR
jgi:hypothetical protein